MATQHGTAKRLMMNKTEWIVLDDATEVARQAYEQILIAAEKAIATRGVFRLVLAGGSTPAVTYQLLAGSNTDFSKWLFFLGDERCLPPDNKDRNSVMIESTLIKQAKIDPAQFFFIPAEKGAVAGANEYTNTIHENTPFDCVLLGLGEDGHTASLFPGHEHPPNISVAPVNQAPKPPADRISLSAETLGNSNTVIFLVAGHGKHAAVANWKNGVEIPASLIQANGRTLVLLDTAANG